MSRSGPSIEMIDTCQSINVDGTLNMLKAAKNNNVKKFVYSASSTHYGNQNAPQKVDMAPDLLNPYGLTKHVGELWVQLFSRVYDLNTTTLRFFNVYGARQPHDGVYGLVIGIFLQALKQQKALQIHGDGSQRRDFIHVKDIARSLIAAMEHKDSGEVFNIGSGTNHSVKQIADLISLNQEHCPRRPGDAEVTLADITLSSERLAWKPEISLQSGIQNLLEE
jgi:nucleoside-diphosphate-sugar epimerase